MKFCAVKKSVVFLLVLFWGPSLLAGELNLSDLIAEVLKNNPEILAAEAGVKVLEHRIAQTEALPEPMFMVGYQNEGYKGYTWGEMAGAQWMLSVSQMFPFWGKRTLKKEMAVWEAESLKEGLHALKLKTILRVKELYFDLLGAYINRDLLKDRADLYAQIEAAAVARYAAGMAPQQEILMAQTERLMLLEKEEMNDQKIQALEGLLNALLGREILSPLGRPSKTAPTPFPLKLEEILQLSREKAPEIKSKEKMIKVAEAKVRMAEKEYYPDITLGASLFKRTGNLEDMWSLTAQINIPLFYKQKQRQALLESHAVLSQSQQELMVARNMQASGLRENFSMIHSAEKLIELYEKGLIPKLVQDFQAALAGYVTGKVEAITVISRLKTLLDVEQLRWGQFIEREKAIARIEALWGKAERNAEEKRS